MLTVKGRSGRETPKRSYSSRNRTPLDALQKGESFIESSNINGRLNLTSLTVVKNFLPSPNLEERFFGLAEHGAKRSALPDRSTHGGSGSAHGEYPYRTVHCTKQSPCASVLAPPDGYLAIFSATLINARYGGCLDVGMSRYRHMRRAGRLGFGNYLIVQIDIGAFKHHFLVSFPEVGR